MLLEFKLLKGLELLSKILNLDYLNCMTVPVKFYYVIMRFFFLIRHKNNSNNNVKVT